jgi:hypothetical protein
MVLISFSTHLIASLIVYIHLQLDARWVLPLHRLWVRPGPPQLMSAPRDPARLDCEHSLPSLAGAHPFGDRAFELYLFFFEFVPRNCGGTKDI